MLTTDIKRKIDSARDILVGKVPDPKAQVDQITNALIYKFMDDMDQESVDMGGKPQFFNNGYEKYAWSKLMDPKLGGLERLNLYVEAITNLSQNPHLPQLFRDIFKDAYLPYRDPETLSLFLKQINEFTYHHSEELGNSFEYLLSILGSQGDAGQFRTPRHIIDFIVSVVDPKKTDRILDPACGTAGFLISAYKHILASHDGKDEAGKPNEENRLTPDERKRLVKSVVGYDISPDMVKLSRVNMYLHGFPEPHIFEYDTLTSEDRWDDSFDVILANPPFMSPKGGIRPHKRFSVQANRAEVLFVDYIAEHLTSNGRAGVIVPEGIIFQSGTAYKQLRKMLVEDYLYAVVSLPNGVFQPYSGVKTSILFLDPELAKRSKNILLVNVENDGRSLGSQRRVQDGNQLDPARSIIAEFRHNPEFTAEELKKSARSKPLFTIGRSLIGGIDAIGNPGELSDLSVEVIDKQQIAETGDFSLTAAISHGALAHNHDFPLVKLSEVVDLIKQKAEKDSWPYIEIGDIDLNSKTYSKKDKKSVGGSIEAGRNDIVISKVRPTRGAISLIVDESAVVSGGFSVLRVKEQLSADYLFNLLRNNESFFKYLGNRSKGAAYPTCTDADVLNFAIPLPPPSVQKEMAEELNGYNRIIEGSRQIEKNWKPSIQIDPDWPVQDLGEISTFKNGLNFSKNSTGELIKVIGVSHFKDNFVAPTSDLPEVRVDAHLKDDYLLQEGDLLFVRSNGNQELVGRSIVMPKTNERISFSGFTIRCRFNDTANPLFYAWLFKTDKYRKILKSVGRGANIRNLSQDILKTIPVPVPSVETQNEIVSEIMNEQKHIKSTMELVALYEQKINEKIASIVG